MMRQALCGLGGVLVFVLAVGAVPAQRLPDVIYMDQPTGIDTATYAATWPQLQPYLVRLTASQSKGVAEDLRRRAQEAGVSDGELNLLAQLEWQCGDLDAADNAASRALALHPNQVLNAFQQAMVDFAHLRRASGMLEQWKWQQRTRDAYQRTFDLDPRNSAARYYLAYSYMNTPWVGGGNKQRALELSEGGIALGQVGFYAVRADAHRVRGEIDAANADYDTAMKLKVIKLGGLLDAATEELDRGQRDRAKRYLDWAVHCRPDAAKVYEGMGDYYAAIGDAGRAAEQYRASIERDPANDSAKRKLAQTVGRGGR